MAKLTEEMKEFIKGKLAYIATVDSEGTPSVGPKGSIRVFDDERIGWNEFIGKHTYENLLQNPKVAVAVVERESRQGYRLVGKAEVLSSGPLYDGMKEQLTKLGHPAPKAVVKVSVDSIFSLNFPGAGEKLA